MLRPANTPPRLVTLILLTGLSVMSLNMFVPSLANIATSLSTSYGLASVLIAGYLASTAVLNLLIGPLSDRYGRRPVVLAGVAVFIVASIGCALATNIETLIALRMLQAAIAVGASSSAAIIRDSLPPREAASRLGYVVMAMALAPMVGPVIGGMLDSYFGWRASFVFMAVAGVMILLLVWSDLGETNVNRSETFAAQLRTYPELLRSPDLWAYSVCSAFSVGAFYVFISGVPLVAQSLLGLSTAALGFYLGTISFGFVVGSFLSGRFAAKAGLSRMILTGRIVACVALLFGLAAVAAGWINTATIFGATVFVGLGNGLTMPSSNVGAMSVRPLLAGSASGLVASLTVACGAVLTVATGAILGGPQSALQLLSIMLFSSAVGLIAALYIWRAQAG